MVVLRMVLLSFCISLRNLYVLKSRASVMLVGLTVVKLYAVGVNVTVSLVLLVVRLMSGGIARLVLLMVVVLLRRKWNMRSMLLAVITPGIFRVLLHGVRCPCRLLPR